MSQVFTRGQELELVLIGAFLVAGTLVLSEEEYERNQLDVLNALGGAAAEWYRGRAGSDDQYLVRYAMDGSGRLAGPLPAASEPYGC